MTKYGVLRFTRSFEKQTEAFENLEDAYKHFNKMIEDESSLYVEVEYYNGKMIMMWSLYE